MTDPYAPDAPARRHPGQYVLPFSGTILVLGVLLMLCSPITALKLVNPPMPDDVVAMHPDDRPPPPPVRTPDAVAVGVVFVLGTLGMTGGLLGLARITYGRLLVLAFAYAMLAYLTLALGYRLTGGLQDVVDSAPTRSAAQMFFVCTIVPIAATVVLLIATIRYFHKPEVRGVFRGVRFGG